MCVCVVGGYCWYDAFLESDNRRGYDCGFDLGYWFGGGLFGTYCARFSDTEC